MRFEPGGKVAVCVWLYRSIDGPYAMSGVVAVIHLAAAAATGVIDTDAEAPCLTSVSRG